MITAVDTNVLLDVFTDDPTFGAGSLAALRACLPEGPLVACDVVWAEISATFPDATAANRALEAIPVAYEPPGRVTAARAGSAWGVYRRAGGPRGRVIANLVIVNPPATDPSRIATYPISHAFSFGLRIGRG